MNEFFTWEILATFSGACIATGLITQFVKNVFAKVPTQLLAYLVAMAIGFAELIVKGSFNLDAIMLAVFNSFLVATCASGTYDFTKRMKVGNINADNNN